ncbi:MAG: DegT/DnrJ/EryC1/StrS family aminotransferase [Dechloromonas sp.]|nr:DegT/DnrJ/EryC1/StrS family aminotransferase [Dechloromonas sp.]
MPTSPPAQNPPIYVTEPYLPPLEEFQPYLEAIWQSRRLTNGGPFHQQFESALAEHLGVEHISLFANGTLALMTALQALRINGEVITTPYTFAATAHSLLWNNLKPVFVDIDPETCNLDPARIEEAITPATTAILPVHCYGTPCAVDRIQQIADAYGLKVIYDAAHAFGVRDPGGSILRHGDLSILSFHATKVFNTFEGGAIISPDARTKQRIDYLKNFGFADEVTVVAPGINGKMSELNAAFGLLQLKHIDAVLDRRRALVDCYRDALHGIPGIHPRQTAPGILDNAAYFPIWVEADYPLTRDQLYEHLRAAGFHGRRYFYPLISDLPMYRGLPSAMPERLPNARDRAQKVICLPLSPHLDSEQIMRITAVISAYKTR